MTTRELDVITREVIWKRVIAICDEMATVLVSTCYSPMIRDVHDYMTGLVDAHCRTISINSGGLPAHFFEAGERVQDGVQLYGADGFKDGDAVMVNHTAVTGQHINNVQIYSPIVVEDGSLVGFAACDAHWQDVGGITANRPTAGTIDCFQEGLQVRSVKIYREGVPQEDVLRLIGGNLRRPDISLGDMRAQVAACARGVARFKELVDEFGIETIRDGIESLWEESEAISRTAIQSIPSGVYEASSFLDDDGYDPDKIVPIAVRVEVEGSDITMDFSGIAEQARGPINSRSNAPINVAMKALTSPDRPLTIGDFAPLRIECPEGKLIRASEGAPMGSWSWPFATILDTIFKALQPAIPDRIPAGNCGNFYGAGFFFGTDPGTGHSFLSLCLLPLGWGARPMGDGTTVHGMMLVGIQDTPVEVTEALYPMEIERYALRCDSGGIGEYRGGLGIEYVVRFKHDTYTSFELDRTKCPPWGLKGGGVGSCGYQKVILPNDSEVIPPRRAVNYLVPAGSRVVIATGGGGGYGDPTRRDPDKVLQDVIDGYVSPERAMADYSVGVVEDGYSYRLAD